MHAAVAYGKIGAFSKLIEQGANIETKNNAGYSALDYAVCYNHKEIFDKLIELGAGIDVKLLKFAKTQDDITRLLTSGRFSNSRLTSVIGNLIDKSSAWFKDDKNGWALIEKVIKDPKLEHQRVSIVNQALEKINNDSRRERLLKCLPGAERAMISYGVAPVKTFWQRLSGMFYTSKNQVKIENPVRRVEELVSVGEDIKRVEEIPEGVKRQGEEIAHKLRCFHSVDTGIQKSPKQYLKRARRLSQ